MKWFEHDVDMHTDLKIQSLMEKHGLCGYAIWLLCLELLGKEGKKGKLTAKERWKEGLNMVILRSGNGSPKVSLDEIINTLAELRLICPKALKYGNLYCPNFVKRIDNYAKRKLRTEYEEDTEKVSLHNITIHNIRLHYITLRQYNINMFTKSDYARTGKAIKEILFRAKGNEDLAKESLTWISKQGYEWSLETVCKKWHDFINYKEGRTPVKNDLTKAQQYTAESMRRFAEKEGVQI